MEKIIHRAGSRGHANHGWLNTYHTFSFANYHNPERIHFGALRVLNDDEVSGGMGFGTHPHDNMEIVSIPLEGSLEHQDSMGNKTVIRKGEVQIMSAGTGVRHSEKNHSNTDPVKFLQIWVFPEEKGIEPNYDQKFFEASERQNKIQTVVSPIDSIDGGVKIHQQSWFSLSDIQTTNDVTYTMHNKKNGLYLLVLEGKISVAEETLEKRDGIGLNGVDKIVIAATENAEILLMEVPMFA
ncbi:MAG: pirin family protein [Cytophagales bacterium]|nr:pirin family protein [Cytophagales bacterium]